MNTGTKVRSALAIAFALYTAFLKTDVAEFGNEIVNLIYSIVMKIVTFVVIFLITYYNNDYSEEGCYGTGVTRQMKAERDPEYQGERFYTDEDGEPLEIFYEGEEADFEEEEEGGEIDEC